ncbi:phosphatidate cytidylyltransferase [Clostridium sp. CM028]|uniref:phosphatidate cytidylyltransferase n=1 Tax=unclassified Clostridium TaxID=2614128 RepID=UPI001C0C9863|nr:MULTISPECIES: phosphatidate cytidylyltransferase [unclassified Clostridium]MBU3092265.1 phosphatidate cytidylyltransferase [Clostridium sp. CF011]MBW9144082.1 phosphatidate cytidylyltransferase [Clostridium sp. CM027]MBW9147607.1 phosphatidate cytidylyltransferase [Clostridium sp. CM028]UVE41270.1 phosphatidate cytidylyltransferase [Clostridium sp. CM027]WAG70267.1 phosphatidate cytidylyltransferase [Clostridium sp. CF011]
MNNRYIGALMLAPLIIFLILGGEYLKYSVMVLSLFGMYEFYKVSRKKHYKPIGIIGYILCIVYYLNMSKDFSASFNVYILIVTILLLLCIPVIYTKYNFVDVALTIFGFLYVAVFFSFIVFINNKTYGQYLVWIIFICSWVCDTSAYYCGRFLGKGGKHKLCPKVSPNKTIEGSIGGLLGSTIGCTIYGYVISKYGVPIQLYHYAIIGVLCGSFGQLGDLIASSIKRFVGAKDYSSLIPGHGGVLDRFDSILFVSVVAFYYITFILVI